jgi:uncharacterized alpha-E superfamily protein
MLSRVAESVFWMSRYIERAENVARFVDVNNNLTLQNDPGFGSQWAPMVQTTGDYDLYVERYGEVTRDGVLRFLTIDEDNPNSIYSCLRTARANARSIRESLSSTMWEELNKTYHMVCEVAATGLDDPFQFFNNIKLASHTLLGISEVTMSHGEAWHFANLGRLIERADKTSRILDVKYFILLPDAGAVGTPLDIVQWSALLKSASALAMYRKAYGRIAPRNVARFLILDRDFPRSIHYCLIWAEKSLRAITDTPAHDYRNHAERQLGRLCADMNYTEISDVIDEGMHEYIDRFQTQLNEVGAAINECFFVAAELPQDLQAPRSLQEIVQ